MQTINSVVCSALLNDKSKKVIEVAKDNYENIVIVIKQFEEIVAVYSFQEIMNLLTIHKNCLRKITKYLSGKLSHKSDILMEELPTNLIKYLHKNSKPIVEISVLEKPSNKKIISRKVVKFGYSSWTALRAQKYTILDVIQSIMKPIDYRAYPITLQNILFRHLCEENKTEPKASLILHLPTAAETLLGEYIHVTQKVPVCTATPAPVCPVLTAPTFLAAVICV